MYVSVTVYPSSRRERVTKTGEYRYDVQVKEPAMRNLANHRVRALIAKEFTVAETAVRMVSGHHSMRKILDVMS